MILDALIGVLTLAAIAIFVLTVRGPRKPESQR